jgi:hypothetical protein
LPLCKLSDSAHKNPEWKAYHENKHCSIFNFKNARQLSHIPWACRGAALRRAQHNITKRKQTTKPDLLNTNPTSWVPQEIGRAVVVNHNFNHCVNETCNMKHFEKRNFTHP